MQIKLRKPKNHLDWLRLYGLYRSAFPAAERKPFGIIAKMYRRGRSDVWCLEAEGRFAGLATTVNGGELVLLDYFAVKKRQRGKGIGSAAMARMQRIYADKGFFVEIESTWEDAPNLAQRQKRKRFYEAAGMEAMEVQADVFGVKMELLGSRCRLDFDRYRAFYHDHYSPWAAQHITQWDEKSDPTEVGSPEISD